MDLWRLVLLLFFFNRSVGPSSARKAEAKTANHVSEEEPKTTLTCPTIPSIGIKETSQYGTSAFFVVVFFFLNPSRCVPSH